MFVHGLWQRDRLGVCMKWKYQSSGLLLLWIYRQHFLLNSGPSLPGCVASRPNKLPYRSLTWVLHMSWKFTVAMWQCSHFQLYLSTGVVDRSPASDLEFEQGGSPLVHASNTCYTPSQWFTAFGEGTLMVVPDKYN